MTLDSGACIPSGPVGRQRRGVADRPIPSSARWAFSGIAENSPKRPITILVFIPLDRDADFRHTVFNHRIIAAGSRLCDADCGD